MAISNKPLVWGPFAAGGTITAFLTPVLITLTLLVALGHAPEQFSYEGLRSLLAPWPAKIAMGAVIFFSLWSAAHRLRITCYDVGVRADALVATFVYLVSIAATLAAMAFLFAI